MKPKSEMFQLPFLITFWLATGKQPSKQPGGLMALSPLWGTRHWERTPRCSGLNISGHLLNQRSKTSPSDHQSITTFYPVHTPFSLYPHQKKKKKKKKITFSCLESHVWRTWEPTTNVSILPAGSRFAQYRKKKNCLAQRHNCHSKQIWMQNLIVERVHDLSQMSHDSP